MHTYTYSTTNTSLTSSYPERDLFFAFAFAFLLLYLLLLLLLHFVFAYFSFVCLFVCLHVCLMAGCMYIYLTHKHTHSSHASTSPYTCVLHAHQSHAHHYAHQVCSNLLSGSDLDCYYVHLHVSCRYVDCAFFIIALTRVSLLIYIICTYRCLWLKSIASRRLRSIVNEYRTNGNHNKQSK